MDAHASRTRALKETFAAWEAPWEAKDYLEAVDDDPTFFNLSAKAEGFFVQRIEADLNVLRKLNMPAILEFRAETKPVSAYLALVGIAEEKFLLKGTGSDGKVIAAGAADLNRHWTGTAYILWKNFLSLSGNIPGNASADSILSLKILLRDLGYTGIPLNKDYDPATQKTIELLQFKYGMPVDGIVGSLTKIILYREGKMFDIPQLARN
jgi:general secretion pathway protein A